MNGVGNDFVIIDVRKNDINFSATQIKKICDRKNIGCDQFILIKNSQKANCFMAIYNTDGSVSESCGNATRCVASLIMEELNQREITIETLAGVLPCKKIGDEISVAMLVPKFAENFYYNNLDFLCANIGNPHAVAFLQQIPADEEFFKIGAEVEKHQFFPNKTNVEFAKILPNNLIEVRVFERGVGETLACGSGACAVGALAIKNKLVQSNKVIVKFKGGDLAIEWQGEGCPVIMTGGYQKIFEGEIDEKFL